MPIPLRADFDASAASCGAAGRSTPRRRGGCWLWRRSTTGATRTDAAEIGGVTLQIVRDWVVKFNAHGPDGLIDRKAPGQPSRLNDTHRAALATIIESGPIPAIHGVVRWRIVDLCQWIWEEFRVSIAKQTLSRELRAMGYRKLSARPRHHAQAEGAIEDFKKTSPPFWTRSRTQGRRSGRHRGLVRRRGPGRPEEQDHPALGPARHPARGAAGSAHRLDLHLRRDLPQTRQGRRPGPAMLQHRGDEPASGRDRDRRDAGRARRAVGRPGRMAPVGQLVVPPNITLVPLPAKCPELNPVENVWQFMRDNWLSNRVFHSYATSSITAACLEQAHRSAMAHHVHRTARLGTWF